MSYFKERIMNTRFLKNGIKSIAFVLVVLVILFALSPVFMPKTNSDLRDKSANGILAEPANSIDVVIVGDSESYSAFIPLQLWNEYGITSYVCGTPKQTLAYSEDFLRKIFKTQKPKIVVLETNAIFRGFSLSSAVLIRADEWFSIYRYHDRWKKMSVSDLTFSRNSMKCDYIENDKGYRIDSSINAASTKEYMKPSEKKEKMPAKNRSYLENIMNLCKDNGAQLMLVSTPSVKNWNCKRHNTVAELAQEYSLEYLDMNLLSEEISIDWSCDTRDAGDHLNHTGAEKATAYFGAYLNSKNIFQDYRKDKEYSDWNKAYSSFLTEIEKTKLQSKKAV